MPKKNRYLADVDGFGWLTGLTGDKRGFDACAMVFAIGAGLAVLALSWPASAQSSAPVACADAPDISPDVIIGACNARLALKDIANADAASVYAVRAAMHERQGYPRRAIDDLTQAIRKRGDDAAIFARRAALYRAIEDDDRAITDLGEAIKFDRSNAKYVFDRAELFRKNGDRRRAFVDYGVVLKLDPAFPHAADHRRQLAREIEKIGALMPVAVRPSFDCSAAQRAVEKAICADIELSQLDRDLDAAFQKAVVQAAPKQVATLRSEQESFLATRNMSFGQAGYDLKRAMSRRLSALRALAN